MDCNDNPSSDFFKAFLHSVRSSCFQFVDFRDRVSIRGFMVVDVDGESQQHYVLSETVSRGKDKGMGSFPLEAVQPARVNGHSLPCSKITPEGGLGLKDETHNKPRPSSTSDTPQNRLKGNPQALDISKHNSRKSSRLTESSKGQRLYKFPNERSDPTNSTFTMETNGQVSPSRAQASAPTQTKEKAYYNIRTSCPSNTSGSLSPGKFQVQETEQTITKKNNNSSFNHRLTHTINKKVCTNQSSSSTRKRPRRSTSASSDTTYCVYTSFESPNSCQDSGPYRSHLSEHIRPKDTEKCKEQQQYYSKCDEVGRNTKSSIRSNRFHSVIGGTFCSEKYHLNPFLAGCESDQECSITSVKPNYLVEHADNDVNNSLTGCPEQNNRRVLCLNADSKAKVQSKLGKFYWTEENIKYLGNSL